MLDLSIGRVNKTKPYLFADAIEVSCSFGGESPLSKTDAFTLIQLAVVPDDESLEIDEPDLDDNNYEDDLGGVEITARAQGYIDECFRQIEYRITQFGETYPFRIEDECLVLKDDLTDRQKLYLVLLAASRIRSFSGIKGMKQVLADFFEVISLAGLKKMMPVTADVIAFGPNSNDRKVRFGTDLRLALPKLAKYMGVKLTPGWDEDLAAQGDGKIDLVGVQALDDGAGGWNVFLAQCAAHEEPESWSKKSAEAKIEFHHHVFAYSVSSQAVLFIPGCFRQPNGHWAKHSFVNGIILMDRVRLLNVIELGDPIETAAEVFMTTHLT